MSKKKVKEIIIMSILIPLVIGLVLLFIEKGLNVSDQAENDNSNNFSDVDDSTIIVGQNIYINNEDHISPTPSNTDSSLNQPLIETGTNEETTEKYDLEITVEEVDMYLRDHSEKNVRYLLCSLTEENIYTFEDTFGNPIEVDEIQLLNEETNEEYKYTTFNQLYGYTFVDIPLGNYKLVISKKGYKQAIYMLVLTTEKLNSEKEKWRLTHYMENPDIQLIYFKINSIKDKDGNLYLDEGFMFGVEGHSRSIRTNEDGSIQYTIRGKPREYVLTYEDENRNIIKYYFTPSDNDVIDIILNEN